MPPPTAPTPAPAPPRPQLPWGLAAPQQQQHLPGPGLGRAAARARVPPGAGQARGLQLMPRRVKYRKAFKSLGFNETVCPNTRQLAWGAFGIRAVGHARVPARTIEAARRALRRAVGKGAMLWIRMTPNVPVSAKPAEVRMGKGKGAVEYWAAPVRPGQIIFELDRVSRKAALDAVAAVGPKLPMRVGFVEWN
jgi:large subunit ribosomal protein L16